MRNPLTIAGCQFSVEADIDRNAAQIRTLMEQAAAAGAHVCHFCETALSGYAGVDVPDTASLDWPRLTAATHTICDTARRLRLWVVLGSTHRLSAGHLPHNCLYIISDQGQIIDRYDKRFCTGVLEPEPTLDLRYYSPGNQMCRFAIDGWECAALICYDYRFPELYRELKRSGAEVLFQSFHNARWEDEHAPRRQLQREIVPATMRCHAATNHLWVSAVNSATRYSSWGNFFVRPDGHLTEQLAEHTTDLLVSTIDPQAELWDAPGPWRDRAIAGTLHSGCLVDDPRSREKQGL